MTESLEEEGTENVEDTPEEDPRMQLRESLAGTLADLSEAIDTPTGMSRELSAFAAGDVSFEGGGSWVSRLADVQGWLNFNADLPTSSVDEFCSSLASELDLNLSETVDADGALTLAALERLTERAELAYRLQQSFSQEMADGASRKSATESWAEAWSDEGGNLDAVGNEPVRIGRAHV